MDAKRPLILLPDIQLHILSSLLNFIYTGEVQVTEENLNDLIDAAEALEIRGLTERAGEAATNMTSAVSPLEKLSSPKKVMTTADVTKVRNRHDIDLERVDIPTISYLSILPALFP